MTDAEIVAALDGTTIHGFELTYEYPGYILATREDCYAEVVISSDWERGGTLDVQLQCSSGESIDQGEIGDVLAWPAHARTVLNFTLLVAPVLAATFAKFKRCPAGWLETRYGILNVVAANSATWESVGLCAHGHPVKRCPGTDEAIDLGCDAELIYRAPK